VDGHELSWLPMRKGAAKMSGARMFLIMVLLACLALPVSVSHAEEIRPTGSVAQEVVLSPADQMILEAIARVNERIDNLGSELNGRIDRINERIDNLGNELNRRIDRLWTAMVGGFLGVMAFIGGIVFWDRRTFSRRVREEFRDELSGDSKKVEAILAVMRKLSDRFPEVREVLQSFGLL
jgi:predicted PurR-regulated permease PerM